LAVIFYTLREPFLPARPKLTSEGGNETATDSPRRRSLTLASQQKSFLCFSFARAGFFLLKGKENFFAGFCS
jgi:hypothetical protein